MTYQSKTQDRPAAENRGQRKTGASAASANANPRTQIARIATAAEELPFAALFYWVD